MVELTSDELSRERWATVYGYEGLYSVSDMGRVRSERRVITRSNGSLLTVSEKYLCSIDARGYAQVGLRKTGSSLWVVRIHQLVMFAFVGPCPDGLEVCHGPGGQLDNRLLNLRYDTRSENTLDQVRSGSHANSKKLVCPLDHDLRAPNLRVSKYRQGLRDCLACHRTRNAQDAALGRREFWSVEDFRRVADQKYFLIMSTG